MQVLEQCLNWINERIKIMQENMNKEKSSEEAIKIFFEEIMHGRSREKRSTESDEGSQGKARNF